MLSRPHTPGSKADTFRSIRVFVSSTSRDVQAEIHHLIGVVGGMGEVYHPARSCDVANKDPGHRATPPMPDTRSTHHVG